MLKKVSVSSTEEKRIVTGLIVSTKFTEAIQHIFKLEYFTNSYLKTIAVWCSAFFEEYKKAPFMHIQDIYAAESHNIKETDSELIEILLSDLSEKYDAEEINVDYWKESAFEYFRKRELEIMVNNISVLKESGNYEAAEAEIDSFKKVSLSIDTGALINLGNLSQTEEIYRKKAEDEKNFFRLPGDLGRYLGNMKRCDVVGFYAPAKAGKSFVLVDMHKHAVLQRRKSLFWSIEMIDTEIIPRMYKSFFPMVDGDEGMYKFPVFDCVRNQTGDCSDRNSEVIVLEDGEFIDDPAHVPCDKCRYYPDIETKRKFVQTVYKEEIFRDTDDIFTLRKKHKRFKRKWNKYSRVSVHPKYTLTYDKMMRDLDVLMQVDNWFPDIIFIDYIDILGIDSQFNDYRLEDEKWKLLAKLAGETNTLVMTVTQANKAGHSAGILDATHQGGFYGKNRHVNLMCGLNQNSDEKEQGVMRFGISEARSQPFIPGKTCSVLQDFASGQAYLDSYYRF